MKREWSWTSSFRQKRFQENQQRKKEKEFYGKRLTASESKEISKKGLFVILLDLEGVCSDIDESTAKLFANQLEALRKKFDCEKVMISISTHYNSSTPIKKVFTILAPYLSSSIQIGISFFLNGIYNYQTDVENILGPQYNFDKLKTFREYYLSCESSKHMVDGFFYHEESLNTVIKGFAIIDDNATDTLYKEFKDKYRMFIARPSQESRSINDNFMNLSTTTKGMLGVIELVDSYLKNIENIDWLDLLYKQLVYEDVRTPIEVKNILLQNDYQLLYYYLQHGCILEKEYTCILTHIRKINIDEVSDLKEIITQIEKFINEHSIKDKEFDTLKKILNNKNS